MTDEPSSITIRAAREPDAPSVSDLLRQLGYPASVEQTADRLRRLCSSAAVNDAILVACANDEPVAWIQVSVVDSLESGPFAEIRGLVVGELHRGARIGEALVRAAEAWARDRGQTRLRVRSNVIRERAHRFYLRLGYQRAKTQAVFVRELT